MKTFTHRQDIEEAMEVYLQAWDDRAYAAHASDWQWLAKCLEGHFGHNDSWRWDLLPAAFIEWWYGRIWRQRTTDGVIETRIPGRDAWVKADELKAEILHRRKYKSIMGNAETARQMNREGL